MLSRLDETEQEKFKQELESPLEGESAADVRVSQETLDRENAAFDAVMGMIGR